jgi:hypothetical protein
MRVRCPGAVALGTATLPGWRFFINQHGYGSITPRSGGVAHGVLWRLNARDLAVINAYENLTGGLYVRRTLPIRFGGRCCAALTFVTVCQGKGTPRPGYMTIVVDAARDWRLPERYVRSLQRWSPSAWAGTRAKDVGELG